MKIYPLAKPHISAADKKQVMAVLNSGQLSLGPKYLEFEKQFAKFIGVKYACAVSSGTAGLHLAMLAAGITAGDEVITSPFSFIASANCILYVGAKPVFADIDPLTYNIDPAEIEKKITKKTKAIVVVHIFGQPADMKPILNIANKYKLKIIEDACESIGAKYQGQNAGTFGESAVFAFYPNKQMTTGEGGMLVTNNKKIYELCCSLRNQGRTQDKQWLNHNILGYNYRLDEMSCALGLSQLKRINFLLRERRKIADWYNQYLSPYDRLVGIPRLGLKRTHTWFVYAIQLLGQNVKRDLVIKQLLKKGISTKAYLPAIHQFDFYRQKYHYSKGDFPLTEKLSARALALPFYIGLTKKDIRLIAHTLINIISAYD